MNEHMNTDANAVTASRLNQEMDRAREVDPEWAMRLDDSRLHVCASAEAADVAWLRVHAPSDFLRGLVVGLYLNN